MMDRFKLWLALRKRREIRIAQGKRVKAGISAAQKRAWRNDPLRRSA